MTARIAIVAFLVLLGVGGCRTTPQPESYVRGPVETAEYYLGNFYRSQLARELYQMLAPAARKPLTYDEFVLQRAREIVVPGLATELSVARVEAAVLSDFPVNARQHVLYALQQVRYPYAGARYNHYRLIRLNVVNVRDVWYVEPFVDERTQTVRLLPSLKRDSLRTLYDRREEISGLVAEDLVALRLGQERPVDDVVTDTSPLVIPDLTDDEFEDGDFGGAREIPDEGETEDPEVKLAGRLEVGKLQFRSGHLDRAEQAFREALEIDPENKEALDYLDRVGKARELLKIRQDITDLMERILEAEGGRTVDNEGGIDDDGPDDEEPQDSPWPE